MNFSIRVPFFRPNHGHVSSRSSSQFRSIRPAGVRLDVVPDITAPLTAPTGTNPLAAPLSLLVICFLLEPSQIEIFHGWLGPFFSIRRGGNRGFSPAISSRSTGRGYLGRISSREGNLFNFSQFKKLRRKFFSFWSLELRFGRLIVIFVVK